MDVIDDKATEEVMNCLLSMSKMSTPQQEVKYWQNYQDGGPSIIWKYNSDNTVQVPYEYKIGKFVLAENVSEEANNSNQIVVIQNLPSHTTQYGHSSDNNFDATLANITHENAINVLEIDPSSLKTESSYSESIDVEVEDLDSGDILIDSVPSSSTSNRKRQAKKKVAIKRKKLKKKVVAVKESKRNVKKGVKTKERGKYKSRLEDGKDVKGENAKYNELTKLEDNADQVAVRFKKGCECAINCFDEFNAEKVFRHRLNIADLTKAEHDMYLMGVIHASMQNPDETSRKKERIRIRTTYAYYGKRVCLTAFLYLNHVTLYQMKIIRKHLQNHGVSPRIHGNHGRKPSNTLPFDIYKHATTFVQNFIQTHHIKNVNESSKSKCKNTYKLPAEYTKKTLHEEYRRYFQESMPSAKAMQYSTFTSFFKKQFPNVKFRKFDKRCDDIQVNVDDKWRKNKRRNKMNVVPSSEMPTDVAGEVEVVDNADFSSFVILEPF